jgi:hypothetical protein
MSAVSDILAPKERVFSMIKRADWLAIGKDRTAVILFLLVFGLAAALVVTTVLRLHASDIQVPVRFTAYGENNIYRDQWYTQLSYVGFAALLLIANVFLAAKTYVINRMLSLGFLAATILVLVIAVVVANAIFNLAPTL